MVNFGMVNIETEVVKVYWVYSEYCFFCVHGVNNVNLVNVVNGALKTLLPDDLEVYHFKKAVIFLS